jgi:hypothetical protein
LWSVHHFLAPWAFMKHIICIIFFFKISQMIC